MRVLQINSVVNYGSTGKIVEQIGLLLKNTGNESYIAYGRKIKESSSETYQISSNFEVLLNGLQTRLFDNHGFGYKRGTLKLIEYIKKIKPDIIHIHNLHGYYVNIEELFKYIKLLNIPIILTLHDCWTFTGHCAYFDYIGCEKWKKHCKECPQIKSYPSSFLFDRSYINFDLKKNLFNSIDKLTIVPVSDWLNKIVQSSFLSLKSRIVIKNGIDLKIFKPLKSRDQIISKYNLSGKLIILGVANIWDARKGLQDIITLAKNLGKDYSIVIVGSRINNKIKKIKNITIIERTENQEQLAELYSAADIFINPTYEDTLPTTNMEALACGTPVITYNTGGSPELIDDKTGFVVPKGNIEKMSDIIKTFSYYEKQKMTFACRVRAEKYFNKDERFKDYINLYERVIKKDN